MKNKIAIIVGHRLKKQGAFSDYLFESEYQFNEKVANHLRGIADVYFREDTPFTTESYKRAQVLNKVNKGNYDLVLSLHFNSFHDENAHGCTALHYITNSRTKKLARKFVYLMNKEFGIRKRELIAISSKKQRGGQMVIGSKSDFVLLEPFFGSNPEACNFIGQHKRYADVIRKLIEYSYEN